MYHFSLVSYAFDAGLRIYCQELKPRRSVLFLSIFFSLKASTAWCSLLIFVLVCASVAVIEHHGNSQGRVYLGLQFQSLFGFAVPEWEPIKGGLVAGKPEWKPQRAHLQQKSWSRESNLHVWRCPPPVMLFPPGRLYHLPKQRHPLVTKYSNICDWGERFHSNNYRASLSWCSNLCGVGLRLDPFPLG